MSLRAQLEAANARAAAQRAEILGVPAFVLAAAARTRFTVVLAQVSEVADLADGGWQVVVSALGRVVKNSPGSAQLARNAVIEIPHPPGGGAPLRYVVEQIRNHPALPEIVLGLREP